MSLCPELVFIESKLRGIECYIEGLNGKNGICMCIHQHRNYSDTLTSGNAGAGNPDR